MDQPTLFELPERPATESPQIVLGKPRLRVAERRQVVMRMLSLDQMLPEDDDARMVWDFVCQTDLSKLYAQVEAVEGVAGRDATDPRILLALWLYATIKRIGSGRELARLCERHLAYQWICGDVTVNHRMLSDFRNQHQHVLNRLLTEQLAALMAAGVVTLESVAQDGMRVRAHAGASSFRTQERLEQYLEQARQRVAELEAELEADPAAGSRRQQAARERAARERAERVSAAQKACVELQLLKDQRGRDSLKHPARASVTDPEARKMKMADGGYRPAYNVQFATDTNSQVIVGMDVIQQGTDGGQLGPMIDQIEERTGIRPKNVLADGGFFSKDDLDELNDPEQGTRVYLPVRDEDKKRAADQDPFAPLSSDSRQVAEWRARMGTSEAKEIYKDRAATAECVNALARNRGLYQFPVRGLEKVKGVTLWYVLAHNMVRGRAVWAALRARPNRE
jgi:transposase